MRVGFEEGAAWMLALFSLRGRFSEKDFYRNSDLRWVGLEGTEALVYRCDVTAT